MEGGCRVRSGLVPFYWLLVTSLTPGKVISWFVNDRQKKDGHTASAGPSN